MSEAGPAADAPKEKKPRKHHWVIVWLPDWPPQDPGRKMLYHERPTAQKALKMSKRLRRQIPEYQWDAASLTHTEVTAMKRAPFVIRDGFARPVRVRWTGRSWRVELLEDEAPAPAPEPAPAPDAS